MEETIEEVPNEQTYYRPSKFSESIIVKAGAVVIAVKVVDILGKIVLARYARR